MSASTASAPQFLNRLIPVTVAVMIGGTLIAATAARLTGYGAGPSLPAVVAAESLAFNDTADGGVAVRNAETGALIAQVPARKDGFLRMTLRLFEAARQRGGVSPAQPFELTQFAGGRMRLSDPATGQSIELEAFGPSNIGEYAKFLQAGAQP
jgi:putative photosynthetic complex assembly protein